MYMNEYGHEMDGGYTIFLTFIQVSNMGLNRENTTREVHFYNALNFIHVNIMTCKLISEKYIKHVF